jgi:hypothetical protein
VERGGLPVGKVGEWYVESRRRQGCSPRLCRLRTDGLTPVSKYWTYRSHAGDMSPVSLVACHRHKLCLSLLLHWLAWERNWVRTCGSVSQHAMDWVGSPFFSGAVGSIQIYQRLVKGCYVLTTWDTYGRWPYVDWSWNACSVLVGFPPARCTSIRIAVTLGYEYRLFMTVIT